MISISKEQWKNNMCIIYAYKNDRKNAKIISDVTMRHLITHNKNGAIDENLITNYFTGYTTVLNELLTEKERHTKFRYLQDDCFKIVEISRKKTHIFFWCTFREQLKTSTRVHVNIRHKQ